MGEGERRGWKGKEKRVMEGKCLNPQISQTWWRKWGRQVGRKIAPSSHVNGRSWIKVTTCFWAVCNPAWATIASRPGQPQTGILVYAHRLQRGRTYFIVVTPAWVSDLFSMKLHVSIDNLHAKWDSLSWTGVPTLLPHRNRAIEPAERLPSPDPLALSLTRKNPSYSNILASGLGAILSHVVNKPIYRQDKN